MADKEYSVDINVRTKIDEASVKAIEDRLKKIQAPAATSTPSGRARPATRPDIEFGDIFKKNLFRSLPEKLSRELKDGFNVALPKFDTSDFSSGLGEALSKVQTGQFKEIAQKVKELQSEMGDIGQGSSRFDFDGAVTSEIEKFKDAVNAANEYIREIAKLTGVSTLDIDAIKKIDAINFEPSSLISSFAGLSDAAGLKGVEEQKQKLAEEIKAELNKLDRIDLAVLFEDGLEAFSTDEMIPEDIRKKVADKITKLQELDFGVMSEAELKEVADNFAIIGNTVVPSMQAILDAYDKSLAEAKQLGVAAVLNPEFVGTASAGRGIPTGTDRSSLGDSPQAKNITNSWQQTLSKFANDPKTDAALNTWMGDTLDGIALEIYNKTLEQMQKSADYFASKEFKGSEFDPNTITKSESQDISAGSNMLGYQLEEFLSKFAENALKRGFEHGSQMELATRALDALEANGSASWQDQTMLGAAETGYAAIEQGFINLTTDLRETIAAPLADQAFRNPAIITDKDLRGGAQKEIKAIIAGLGAELEQIKKRPAATAVAKEEPKKEVGDTVRSTVSEFAATTKQLRVLKQEIEALSGEYEKAKGIFPEAQKILSDPQAKPYDMAWAASQKDPSDVKARLDKAIAELDSAKTRIPEIVSKMQEVGNRDLQAQQNAFQPQASKQHPLLDSLAKFEQDFAERLSKFGKIDVVAFDTEFNDALGQKITEAAITVKDTMGQIVDVFEFVQAPPADSWKTNPNVPFQPGSRSALESIAKKGMIPGGIGSTDEVENALELYEKIYKTMSSISMLTKDGAMVLGNNADQTDLNALGKAIEYVNKKIQELGINLPAIEDLTAGIPTLQPNKILASSGQPDLKALGADGKGLGAVMEKVIENFSQYMDDQQKAMFRMGKAGLEVKVQNLETGVEKWLPAHFAKVDNRIALAIKAVLDQIAPAQTSVPTTVTKDYRLERKAKDKKAAEAEAGAGGSGGLDARSTAGAENADNARKRFLAESQIFAIYQELTKLERESASTALVKLEKQAAYKKLVETEKSIREEISDLESSGAGAEVIKARREELLKTIVAGRQLERQAIEDVKSTIRANDVKKQYQQTAAGVIDTQIELEKVAKKAFSEQIRGQMQKQVDSSKELQAATKNVEAQTKSLINTWVTGRYALYDVGNAYAGVARQLWMASRQIFNVAQSYRAYETAFTSVERAIEPLVVSIAGAREEATSLKNAFIDLSEQIPVSFEEISRIATLGAQMGVSASGIVNFTEVVAQFASVTGVAADTVAQKFGRIAELANVDFSEFNNLGSSILYAGINAVATEAEIMTLAESIAAVSTQAGLVPSEIVGMSTALASTGIQAEQARGVFTRVFADIDRVVSVGGKGLDNFAKIAGMSSEDFATAWGTEGASYDVFRAILGGLSATKDMTAAFDSLNIVETREVNTLTRLAENLNVVDQAISDATDSFAAGAFLGSTFDKTVDNLDAQIQIFQNNVKSLTEELSKGLAGNLKDVIGFANEFLQTLKIMAKNPLFATLTGMSLGITAFGAAAALGVSAVAKLVAQVYAFRVAAINTANDKTAITGPLQMLKQLTGWGGGLIEMRDQLKGISPDVRGVVTPMNISMIDSFGDAIGRTAGKVGFLSDGLKKADRVRNSFLKAQNIYLASSRIEADTITQIIAARKADIAEIESQTMAKSVESATTKSQIDSINSHNAAMEKERASRLAAIGGSQIYVATVNGETRALTANEYARLNGIANSGKVSLAKQKEAKAILATAVAIDTETRSATKASKMQLGPGAALLGIATSLGSALVAFSAISTVVGFISAEIEKTKINLLESGGGVASLRDAIKQDTLEYEKLSAAQKATTDQFNTFTVKTQENTAAIDPNAKAIGAAAGASSNWIEKNKIATEQIGQQTIALGKNTKEWALNAMMQDENLQEALKLDPNMLSNLEKYGTSFKEVIEGIFADPNSNQTAGLEAQLDLINAQIQAATDAANASQTGLRDYDAENNIAGLRAQKKELETTIATVKSLATALQTAIAQGDVWGVIRGMLGLEEAITETDASAQELTDTMQSLRTVLDYATDLNGILSRIVELNFGAQITRDDITTGWRDIAKSATDAKDAVEEANNEINGLKADRRILEYQLSVAERYGDEARAAKIRAELAKVNKNVADSEKQLAEAQSNASTELEGNSDAAIKNRAALLGMVGTYQSRIEMLAKLGMNQSELEDSSETLKRQFLAEAKALGFSGKQLDDYAALFDNFTEAASDAPRNVDIEVVPGLTAAEQAIEEFLAKERSTTVDVVLDTSDTEPLKIDQINTLVADGTLNSWLTLEREFGAPKVTGITADAADKKIQEWLNLVRILAAPRIDAVNTLAADGSLKSWLILERYFGAPKVTNITADAADKKINDFLNKERNITVNLKINSSQMAEAEATAALGLARAYPVNSAQYTRYMEQYRALLAVANTLRSKGMATGGLVRGPGSGTSDSIPTMLSNGEFVMQASSVKAYGVDFFNALNQQRVGAAPVGAASMPGMSQGPSMVFLSPEDRQLLRQFGDRPVNLYADSTKIAEVANNGNTKMSRRGTR